MAEESKPKGRGGYRPGAGRKPKTKLIVEQAIAAKESHQGEEVAKTGGAAFAERVLGRIGEGRPKVVTCVEDYALQLLYEADMQTRSLNLNRLLDRLYGKPASGQGEDARQDNRPLDRGDIPSHFAASGNTGPASKPN